MGQGPEAPPKGNQHGPGKLGKARGARQRGGRERSPTWGPIDDPTHPRQILNRLRSRETRRFLKHFSYLLRFTMAVFMDLVRAHRALPLSLMAILSVGVGPRLHAQGTATLQVEENLRAEPRGTIIGRLLAGRTFPVVEIRDPWVQVAVEGWIWTPSLQTTDRGGFDLSVSVAPTENLRAEPQGEVLAHLAQGALLEELDETTGWKRVRRTAWVWGESVEVDEGASPVSPIEGRGDDVSALSERWWRSGSDGAPLLSGPDGDTLARTHPGAELQVLAREGNWVRVRLDGWAWAPVGEVPDSAPISPVAELTLETVMREPGDHRGRVVSWTLQFVSLERAEKIRTDFYEGEPFLLTRTSSSGSSFVYVAVPPDRLGEVEGLTPLERVNIVGRIRTGAAALTGNPILDLIELTRVSRD
jgi:hypothetical protein